MKLYRAKIIMGYSSVVEVVNALADADVIAHLNNEFRKEFEAVERTESGKQSVYGSKQRSRHHRTPDGVAIDRRIKFEDIDKELAESEVNDGA